MSLPTLQLAEPLISSMVSLLKANLNATIDSLNATVTDGYTVDHVVQFLPYVPVPSTLQGGMPAVGVQELPGRFEDDLQFRVDAEYEYAVVAVIQNADQAGLTWQLRRTMQAIAATIEADRLSATSVMRASPALAWSVEFVRTEPGPLLGDLDPTNPEAPPRSYLSWCALTLSSKRGEV